MAGQNSFPLPANVNLWVLDFLLESDGLDDTLIKHFHDVNSAQFEQLPPSTQARLMLRVLRDAPAQMTGVAEAALGALNMLRNLADQLAEAYGHAFSMDLRPHEDLFLDVKTELVLKNLRDENATEHPRMVMDRYFVPNEHTLMLTPGEMGRRNEIVEGLKGPEEIQNLLKRHPVDKLNTNLLTFVAAARQALGPNVLKIVEKDVAEGRYHPHMVQFQGSKRRKRGSATVEMEAERVLSNAGHSTGALGGSEGLEPQTDGQQGGRMEVSDDGSKALPGMSTEAGAGRGKQGGPAARRRNGRWSEEETALLIRSVRERGKGKWKRILEDGASVFQNRSQVDLKDKWRNLERQGVVGPQDLPPAPLPQLPGQVQLGIPQALGQIGAEGLFLPAVMPNGEPMTESQAQQYAALANHYGLAAPGQQGQQLPHIPPELQQLAQQFQNFPSQLLHVGDAQLHLHQQVHQQQQEEHAQLSDHQHTGEQDHHHAVSMPTDGSLRQDQGQMEQGTGEEHMLEQSAPQMQDSELMANTGHGQGPETSLEDGEQHGSSSIAADGTNKT